MIGSLEDVDDIGHVRGKGRQRLLDALFVADIGEDALKDRERRFLRRDLQAALRHHDD